MISNACAQCGAAGENVISRIEDGRPVSRLYCDSCWRVAREEAGPIMTEGPVTWGQDWPEMEEWLARNLRVADERPESAAWRRLLAHVLRQQLSHLPAEVPPFTATFLMECDDRAG